MKKLKSMVKILTIGTCTVAFLIVAFHNIKSEPDPQSTPQPTNTPQPRYTPRAKWGYCAPGQKVGDACHSSAAGMGHYWGKCMYIYEGSVGFMVCNGTGFGSQKKCPLCQGNKVVPKPPNSPKPKDSVPKFPRKTPKKKGIIVK